MSIWSTTANMKAYDDFVAADGFYATEETVDSVSREGALYLSVSSLCPGLARLSVDDVEGSAEVFIDKALAVELRDALAAWVDG